MEIQGTPFPIIGVIPALMIRKEKHMSKNAYVLDDHFGDDGHVTAGMILHDVTSKRFEELEKKGLIREATPEEVKAGDQHSIDEDESKMSDEGGKAKEKAENKQAATPSNKAAPKTGDKAD